FQLARVTYDSYMKKLQERKGIVEERILGEEIRSPSVQLRVTPLGKLELLSTHDQLLGGPSGQSYLGCVFPADSGYAALITREAAKLAGASRKKESSGVLRWILWLCVRMENGRLMPSRLTCEKAAPLTPF